MANKSDKYSSNAVGKFYVDTQCIDCDLCREVAPDNFTRDDSGQGNSIVYKQPINADEEKRCKEALESCPVDAIGSDGQ